MNEPLRALYELCEEQLGSHPMTKEERKIWDRAQAVLGEDVIDELVHAQSRSLVEGQYDCFRAGFLLGARLILEVR